MIPPAICPDCRKPGYNVTSFDDVEYTYVCWTDACPTETFRRGVVDGRLRDRARAEFDTLRVALRARADD